MNVVITGANRGIGLELCKQLLQKNANIIALCRTASPELKNLDLGIIEGVDLREDPSLVVKKIDKPVDILINNAGILLRESLEDLNVEQIRKQFEVNSIGPLRLSHAFLPLLDHGAKIALITSRMGSIGDNESGARYGYRMSKAALNMAGVSLAHDLRLRGIAVAILHPGFVRTRMTNFNGLIDPPESATGLLERIDALTLENSGTFWHQNGEVLPW